MKWAGDLAAAGPWMSPDGVYFFSPAPSFFGVMASK